MAAAQTFLPAWSSGLEPPQRPYHHTSTHLHTHTHKCFCLAHTHPLILHTPFRSWCNLDNTGVYIRGLSPWMKQKYSDFMEVMDRFYSIYFLWSAWTERWYNVFVGSLYCIIYSHTERYNEVCSNGALWSMISSYERWSMIWFSTNSANSVTETKCND